MLYPRQPHMHVCLFDASALFCRFTSPHTQTHTHANLSVCAPVFQTSVHLWGLEGRGGEGGWRERQGGVRGSEREWASHPDTVLPCSLPPSPILPSFPRAE